MQPVLPLFDRAEEVSEPVDAVALARCSTDTPPGIAYFHLAALEGLLPQWFLEGVDCDERIVIPGEAAMVVYASRSGVSAREMLWSNASTRTTSPWQAAWHHEILPRLGKFIAEQRAVVIVSRIGLRCDASASASAAWVTAAQSQPIYLAGLWRATAHGPQFTLLQQRASGAIKMAGPHMPVVIDDANVWEWLNGRRPLVPFTSWRKRNQCSVSFAAR